MIEINGAKLFNANCLDILPKLDKVDAIIVDVPYGTTDAKWDSIIPFKEMWGCISGVLKTDNTPIVIFGAEPFSSKLRVSKLEWYKYDWYWNKQNGSGFLNAKKQPLRAVETISIFSKGKTNYFPIMEEGKPYLNHYASKKGSEIYEKDWKTNNNVELISQRYPKNVLNFKREFGKKRHHVSQKPQSLMEYLVKTYTKEGDIVLDFTMGSGSTGIACLNLNRKFIGVEACIDKFNTACMRIRNETNQNNLFA